MAPLLRGVRGRALRRAGGAAPSCARGHARPHNDDRRGVAGAAHDRVADRLGGCSRRARERRLPRAHLQRPRRERLRTDRSPRRAHAARRPHRGGERRVRAAPRRDAAPARGVSGRAAGGRLVAAGRRRRPRPRLPGGLRSPTRAEGRRDADARLGRRGRGPLRPFRLQQRAGRAARLARPASPGSARAGPGVTSQPAMDVQAPTFADVLEARRNISPYLRPTPLYRYAALDELLGADVFVKHENHQPVGAFKVRGGVNLVSQLTAEERERGVIAASTGNHGQSIAYAARPFGVPATIYVPEAANPVKVAAMRGLGAELVFHGRDYDEARERCEQLASEHGYRYIHSGNEPLLIAGVATQTLEVLEEQPRIDVLVVPIGGGSGAAGACIVANAVDPAVTVLGVQSASAPAAYRSWRERRLVEDRTETYAEGLATRTAFELPQRILWDALDDFILVEDDEIRAAQAFMIETTRNLIEAAGAAPLAAGRRRRTRPRSQ